MLATCCCHLMLRMHLSFRRLNEFKLFYCLLYGGQVSLPQRRVLRTQARETAILAFSVTLLFHACFERRAKVVAALPILLLISASKGSLHIWDGETKIGEIFDIISQFTYC